MIEPFEHPTSILGTDDLAVVSTETTTSPDRCSIPTMIVDLACRAALSIRLRNTCVSRRSSPRTRIGCSSASICTA